MKWFKKLFLPATDDKISIINKITLSPDDYSQIYVFVTINSYCKNIIDYNKYINIILRHLTTGSAIPKFTILYDKIDITIFDFFIHNDFPIDYNEYSSKFIECSKKLVLAYEEIKDKNDKTFNDENNLQHAEVLIENIVEIIERINSASK